MRFFQILVITIVVKNSVGFLMTPPLGNYQSEVAKRELLRLIKVRQLVVNIYNALTLDVRVRKEELNNMIDREIHYLKRNIKNHLSSDTYVPNMGLLENLYDYIMSNWTYDKYEVLLDDWARTVESDTSVDLSSPFLEIVAIFVTDPLNFLGIESSYKLVVTPRKPDTCVKSFVADLIQNSKRVIKDYYRSALNLTQKGQKSQAVKIMNDFNKLALDLSRMKDENSRFHAEHLATYIDGLKGKDMVTAIGSHEFLYIVFRENIHYDVKNDSHLDTQYWRRVMKFLNQPLGFLGHHFELYNIDREIATCLKFNMISLIQKRKKAALQYKTCAVEFDPKKLNSLKHQIETFRDQPWMKILNEFIDNHVPLISTEESISVERYLFTVNHFAKMMTGEPLEELDTNFWMEVKTFLTGPFNFPETTLKRKENVDGQKENSTVKSQNIEDEFKNRFLKKITDRIGEIGRMLHSGPKSDYLPHQLDSLKSDMDEMNCQGFKSLIEYLNKNYWPKWTESKKDPVHVAQMYKWFLTYLSGTVKSPTFKRSYFETKCWKRIMEFVNPVPI